MTVTTDHKYVRLNDSDMPIIAGTTMKVVELVTAQKAYGWSPEEIHFSASVSEYEPDLFGSGLLLGPQG